MSTDRRPRSRRVVPRRTASLVVFGAAIALAFQLVSLSACTRSGGPADAPEPSSYVETGDLPDILEHGRLRVLMPTFHPATLTRRGSTIDEDLRLARLLAGSLGVELEIVTVRERDSLLDALIEGRGDLVLARLTATDARRERFEFSVPLDYVREMLVVRADETRIVAIEDLAGLRVAVRPSSSFRETLENLREDVPDVEIVEVDEALDTEQILYGLTTDGPYDATVADEDLLREVTTYLDVRGVVPLTEDRPIAWAMRPGNPELKAMVDAFLHRQALAGDRSDKLLGGLEAVRERRVLRVLTRNNASTYFLYRGRQLGFEYELASRFAKSIGCRLEIVVPERAEQLIDWLREGRGDLIAAGLTVTPERRERVSFSRPYNRVSEMVVARADDDTIDSLDDLAGRSIAVRASSSYRKTLDPIADVYGFEIVDAPEELETEELIAKVGEGVYDLTVADSNILDIELTYRDDIRGAIAFGGPRNIAWAVRPEDGDLLEAVDRFLAAEYRGTFYNILKKRYFKDARRIARVVRERPSRQGSLSPYDDLFRRYGRSVEIDWRLLAAQAYQESRFDPDAESWAGAVGIMQVLPRTARELGIEGDLRDPEVGIEAGARYLRWLLDLFEPTMEFSERLRLALASYNAGRGHVLDGRRLAREKGLDPDVWFANVEAVLPLLGKSSYAAKARYGYCRCREPVAYVRQVNDRYRAYVQLVPDYLDTRIATVSAP